MIYSIVDLKKRIAPVAKKYHLRAVYLFGSYARNEATDNSDIDILVDREGSLIKNAFDMGELYEELCYATNKGVDLLTTQMLEQPSTNARTT